MSSDSRLRSLQKIYGPLALVLVVAPALALGGVHARTQTLAFAAAALCLFLALFERTLRHKRVPLSLPMLVLAAACVLTGLQLVPLPASVIAVISPTAHQTFKMTLGDYGFHALTLDPSGTAAELAKLGGYLAFFVSASIYASYGSRRRRILILVTATACLVAAIGFAQALAGTDRLLFFYQTQATSNAIVRGTFGNANHFGGLMCLAAPCALVLGLREPRLRWFAMPAAIFINLAVVLSLSRSAIAAALLGQLLTLVLDRTEGARPGRSGSRGQVVARRIAMLSVIGIALTVAIVIGADKLKQRERSTNWSEVTSFGGKIYAQRRGVELIWQYPWTGAGRGAFEQAYTRVYDRGGALRWHWVEDGYLQVLIDWGPPAGLFLLVLTGTCVVAATRRLRDEPFAVGAFGALVALAGHEAFDFSIEYPGVAFPALAVLATLFSRREVQERSPILRVPAQAWMLVLPVAVAAAIVIAPRLPSAEADGDAVAAISRDSRMPIESVLAAGSAARNHHPADYYIDAVVGERLAHARNPAAMSWLNRAIYLNPSHPGAHLVAAELLATGGRKSQALLEYRTAVELSELPDPVWASLTAHYHRTEDLLTATSRDPAILQGLAVWLISKERRAAADQVCARLHEVDPKNVWAMQWSVQLALDLGQNQRALERVKTLLAADQSDKSRRLEAWSYRALGDDAALEKVLDAGLEHSDEALFLELGFIQRLTELGQLDRARARAARLDSMWRLERGGQIRLHEALAAIETAAGNTAQAQFEHEQAARLQER